MNQYSEELKSKCSRSCNKDGECIKFVQLYLDGMACKVKDAYFLDGICDCPPCSEYFKLHECIKVNLKTKMEEVPLPDNLSDKIKACLHL